jgi:TonB family protein
MKRISLLFLLSFISISAWSQNDNNKISPVTEDKSVEPADTNKVYQVAEVNAEFPGGQTAFLEYLRTSIKYPVLEKEKDQQGTVYVSFIIEKDGSITNVTVVRGVKDAPGLSKEAVRVISEMPRWTPAKIAGKPVRLSMVQPIKFVLEDKSKKK